MFEELFENVGGKIKVWAKRLFVIETIASIIYAIVLPASSGDPDDFIFISFLIVILGPTIAWISSLFLYAFGELVEDTHALRKKECSSEDDVKSDSYTTSNETDNAQKFTCPKCGKTTYFGTAKCECGQTFDWSKV